jgi:ABC-type molybdate transport system substrate-binding protein
MYARFARTAWSRLYALQRPCAVRAFRRPSSPPPRSPRASPRSAGFTAKPRGAREFSFGASSALATQLEQGAPADVIATADEVTMNGSSTRGSSTPHPFAKNRLAIAVEPKTRTVPGSPTGEAGAQGRARRRAGSGRPLRASGAGAAKVTVTPVSLEPDVKAVLTKVSSARPTRIVYAPT